MIINHNGEPRLKRTTTNELFEAARNKFDFSGNINCPSDSEQTDSSIIDAEDYDSFPPEFQENSLFTRAILNRPDNEDSLRGIGLNA
ncbi:hypothetical protein [Methanoplanus limicola]|uniref:Uncharacterized protein n=1 Tax=Methanoplanus limicola DSM 2279 TaxID=937775 RepID=H1Z187_9EURY|nr:hypothetical protein [Methanoplanus limicola]EHQ35354.1 hypothetical protein Metlim_1244 [Methanoplanus limicola DSM 2279]